MHRYESMLLPLTLSALVQASGCDPELEPPEFRTGQGYQLSYSDQILDPVPGGGGCEGCVTCFAHVNKTTRHLCMRADARFTGSDVYPGDDLPLSFTEKQMKWQLHDASRNPLCSGDSCKATVLPLLAVDQFTLELDVSKSGAPRTLRFIQLDDNVWRVGPEIRIPKDLDPPGVITDPDPGFAEPVTDSDVITDAMAHITHPAESGGVRSCSGFLVTDQMVLTAAHCLVEPSILNYSKIPGWPGWGVVPAATVDVRVGGLHGPDDLDGNMQTAVAIHIFSDPDVDLALVELAGFPGVTPLSMNLQAAGPGDSSTLVAYGYGVSGSLPDADGTSYDWGRLKRTLLEEESSVRPSLGNAAKVVTFAPPPGMGVCHGDSGGPVVRTIDGTSAVVGVMLARVVAVGDELFSDKYFDLLGGAGFAFSRHNDCGIGSPLAYVAARLDRPDVQKWLASFTLTPHMIDLPLDPPIYLLFDPPEQAI